MTRTDHDDEQYKEAQSLAFRRVFDALVADGVDEEFAALLADDEARAEVDGQVQSARDNALACLIGRHEFA
jgi:hypothetical protein